MQSIRVRVGSVVGGNMIDNFTVAIKNFEYIKKELEKMAPRSEAVINSTLKDFKSRGPAWVSKATREVYNIDAKTVKKSVSKKNKVNVGLQSLGGRIVDNVQIVYVGKVLTATHFKMKPGKRLKRPKPVTAEIYKGRRKRLGQSVFIGSPSGVALPFQRVGKERVPLNVIRTVSVPQMVQNDYVRLKILNAMRVNLGKRFEHHLAREFARVAKFN